VFYGDSITDAWRLNEYFPGQDYVNRGISGQVTGEMLGRLKADVLDLKPQAVLILAGTNDIGRGIPLSTIQGNLTMIADLLTHHKIKPVFASVLPISDYHKDKNITFEQSKRRPPEQIQSLNQWLRAFCVNRGYPYLNYFDAMVDPQGFLKAELADDGLHPNGSGYRVMAPLAHEAINKVLGRK
jgi:lysophospholipase L1-like esterase